MNRRALAIAGLVALVFLSGCSTFSGGGQDDLLNNQTYQWETNSTATYNLSVASDEYTAVVAIENQTTLSVYRSTAFRGDQSLSVESLQFRFENGTVVNATHTNLTASEKSDKTKLGLPARNGTVAWTSPRDGKQWSTPVFVEGRHKVILPESTRVGIPFLSQTSPNTDRSTLEDDQMTLLWEDPSDSISVRYYLVRDLYIFGSIAVVVILIGLGGTLYYLRQIRAARQKREDVGLEMDYDDDVGDDGPPPGMR
jgi:hypothetical protein